MNTVTLVDAFSGIARNTLTVEGEITASTS